MDYAAIEPFVVHESMVEDHRRDGLRSGEGSVVELPGGELLMVYSRFRGPADHDRADLVERRSLDGGLTWSPAALFRSAPADALNLMSVSLLALPGNRLACLFLLKQSAALSCRPMFMAGCASGRRWETPVCIADRPGYFVVNNDRLVRLSGGRLLVPFCFEGYCACFYSDDGGRDWKRGAGIAAEPARVRRPMFVEAGIDRHLDHVLEGRVTCQEPGVVETGDGRLMMWCRTNGGYAYRAYSGDRGETWSPFEAIAGLAMPNGPQSIRLLPGSDRLVMLYNDRAGIPFNYSQFGWRRPLAVAVSDDHGRAWRRLGLLEPDSVPSNCYYSICFHGENALFTYYEGVMKTRPGGVFAPRNLASLKLKIVRRAAFESGP